MFSASIAALRSSRASMGSMVSSMEAAARSVAASVSSAVAPRVFVDGRYLTEAAMFWGVHLAIVYSQRKVVTF